METKKDEAFGIIPVSKVDGEWRVFLIHQISRHGDTFWAFPKGHSEAGEGPLDAAQRELHEETGLTPATIDEHCVFTEYYVFEADGAAVEKTVTYYLGYIESLESKLQAKEVSEGEWLGFEDAKERLTHESKRELVDELGAHLRKV